jgi:large conductance mechanosensitive channel
MLKEFKAFIMRGNVLDLAVAVVIGAAFGKIISSLVSDVLMPPIGLVLGKVDFSNLYLNLSGTPYQSLAAAKDAGAATLNYGLFLNAAINFLIVAFALFLVIRTANRMQAAMQKPAEAAAPTTKECPFCAMAIPVAAKRCGHCTSTL